MKTTIDLEEPLAVHHWDSDAFLRPAHSPCVFVKGRRVDVPAGHSLAKGCVEPADKYLSLVEFTKTGSVSFAKADEFVGKKPISGPGGVPLDLDHAADCFAMLIRPLSMVDD